MATCETLQALVDVLGTMELMALAASDSDDDFLPKLRGYDSSGQRKSAD